MSRLILKFKDKILTVHPLTDGSGVTIGRHSSNDIVIDNLAVSGYHARVDRGEQGFKLIDLQSKNGTFVNSRQIAESPLNHNDTITIGKHTLLVDVTDDIPLDETDATQGGVKTDLPSPMSDAKTMVLDTSHGRIMRGEEPPEPTRPTIDYLLFLAGGQGEHALSQSGVSIGKNSDADIVVSGIWALLMGGPAATITKQAGDYFLRYAGGLIKPKRNGASVKGTVKLKHDDIVEVGPIKVQIQLSSRNAG